MAHRGVGADVMGVGITTLAIGCGHAATLVEIDQGKLGRTRALVRNELRMANLMGAFPPGGLVGELTMSDRVADAVGAAAVVETITESAELKIRVQGEIAEVIALGILRVCNTPSIPINEIAVATAQPEDLVGVHFMNPPYRRS